MTAHASESLCGPGTCIAGQPLRSGDRVRVERDETRYPSKGTWPQYRGRAGTVVTVNRRFAPVEYGVVFGATRERASGVLDGGVLTWFKRHELTRVTS